MASVRVAFTIKSSHPRVWTDAGDLNAYFLRAVNTAGPSINGVTDSWNRWWSVDMRPWLRSSLSPTPLNNVGNSFNLKMLALGMADWLGFSVIDNYDYAAVARANALEMASHFNAGDSVVASNDQTRRDQILGMVAVYDFCYSKLSVSDRATIADGILDGLDTLSIPASPNNPSKELMDGHTRIDQAIVILATLAIQGEPTLVSRINTHQDRGLDYWFGGNAAITVSGYAALDTDRFYSSDGGAAKGPHYQTLSNWGLLQMLHALRTATTGLTLDGNAYDPWQETWTMKAPLWFLALGLRPDGEAFSLGDTIRQNNPIFPQQARLNYTLFQGVGDYKREIHNLYNLWQGLSAAQGQGRTYDRAADFIFSHRDPAQIPAENASLSSANGLLAFPNAGAFVYTAGPIGGNSLTAKKCIIHSQLTKWYYRGHRDLDCGLLQICHEDDMVLLNTGYYSTSSGETAAIAGGTHNLYWRKMSVSKSGIPLCEDGASNPHQNYNSAGTRINLPSGEGGQYFKQLSGSLDHENVINMQADGGGLAWRCTEGRTIATGAEAILQGQRQHFIYGNTRKAYLKQYTEEGTSTERVLGVHHNLLIIRENEESADPIVFRVLHMKSRLGGFLKQDQWHFWGNPNLSEFATSGRFVANGYRAEEGLSLGSKCVIKYYKPSDYTIGQTGNGTVSAFGSSQFRQGGSNYPPDFLNSPRHLPDIGRFRVSVRPVALNQDTWFVAAIFPLKADGSEPAHEFFETIDYFGLRFFATGNVYQIAKADAAAIGPEGGVDTTPPAAVTNLVGTTPASQRAQLTWTPVANDPSMDNGGKYRVYRRLG